MAADRNGNDGDAGARMPEKPLPGARKRSTRGIAIAAVDHAPLFTDGLRGLVDEIPTLRWAGCDYECPVTRDDG
jgi:hypothetical protein